VIYTVRGELVRTLHQDGSQGGYVVWDLRTKDNLDVAPGLFVFQVDAPGVGTRSASSRSSNDHALHAVAPALTDRLLAALAALYVIAREAGAQSKTGTTIGQFPPSSPARATRRWATLASRRSRISTASTTTPRSPRTRPCRVAFSHVDWFAVFATTTSRASCRSVNGERLRHRHVAEFGRHTFAP
jgi:hypothetical protein